MVHPRPPPVPQWGTGVLPSFAWELPDIHGPRGHGEQGFSKIGGRGTDNPREQLSSLLSVPPRLPIGEPGGGRGAAPKGGSTPPVIPSFAWDIGGSTQASLGAHPLSPHRRGPSSDAHSSQPRRRGKLSEWLNEIALKAIIRKYREFESHTFRRGCAPCLGFPDMGGQGAHTLVQGGGAILVSSMVEQGAVNAKTEVRFLHE